MRPDMNKGDAFVKQMPLIAILLTLASISAWFVCKNVILPNIDRRMEHESKILSGQMEPPYQYRLLEPLLGAAGRAAVSLFTENERAQHVVSYALISFAAFLGVFVSFYFYLRLDFSENASLMGTLLLQAVIPLSVTGMYMEGDFINLLFYILALILIRRGKDRWLPVLFVLGALNREQFVFMALWYILYLIAKRKAAISTALLAAACLLAWGAAFLGTRLVFGFAPTQYTIALHVARNTDAVNLFLAVIPLWAAEVAGFAFLCVLAFRSSNWFYRLSFLSLLPYSVLFFLNGNLWELAKFLPAFTAMIPMSLQLLTGEFSH